MFSVRGKGIVSEAGLPVLRSSEDPTTSKVQDTKRLYEIIASCEIRAQASLARGAGHSPRRFRGASYHRWTAFQDEMAGSDIISSSKNWKRF